MPGRSPKPAASLARNPLAWLLLFALLLAGLALLRGGPKQPVAPAPASATATAVIKTLPDRDPEPIERIKPTYPPDALSRGDQGYVTVSVEIDAQGLPTDVGLSRSSGHDALDQSALDAVRQWRFRPAIRLGKPVASRLEVPILFKPDAPP